MGSPLENISLQVDDQYRSNKNSSPRTIPLVNSNNKTMKNLKLAFLILLIGGASTGSAQSEYRSASWTVEWNIKQPNYTIIRFYDAQSLLIKEEKVIGKFLDIRKKRNQKLLDQKLEALLHPQLQVIVHRRKVKDSMP
jgi:hypothetical protein